MQARRVIRPSLRLVDEPDRLRSALGPLRRVLLERLREPASATELAAGLGLPRQRVNYHVRALERDGLVELVQERRRRGCTERVLRATADAFVVDPQVLAGPAPAPSSSLTERDRFAAEHLMRAATATVQEVGRMTAAAHQAGRRLLTFTLEAELLFAAPADVHRFTGELAQALTELAERYATSDGGRPYRVVIGGHPAPRPAHDPTPDQPPSTPGSEP